MLTLTPEDFARGAGLSTFEVAHILAGEPLPHQSYQPVFRYFLTAPERIHHTPMLARGLLADALSECHVGEELIEDILECWDSDAAVAHLFGQLPIPYLVALWVVGEATMKSGTARSVLFEVAEMCRKVANQQTVPQGYFRQFVEARPTGYQLLGGSVGATVSKIKAPQNKEP